MSTTLVAAESAAADIPIAASDSGGPEFDNGLASGGESDAKPSNDHMLEGASTEEKEETVDSDGKSKPNSRAREVRLDQNRKVSTSDNFDNVVWHLSI